MKQLNLGTTKTSKIFWAYVIPSVLSIIFSTTAQFVDSIFIGRMVGENGLASITMLNPFISIINGVGIMIAIGGVTYAGINRGKNDYKRANYFFNLTVKLAIITSLIGTGLFLLLNQNYHLFFDADQETIRNMQSYGFIISFVFVLMLLNLVFTLFLNLDEKPTWAVIVTSIATALNVLFNFIFIFILDLGITGAALGTALSLIIETIIFLFVMRKTTWSFANVKINIKDSKSIFFNGSSELLNISSMAIASFVLNSVILNNVGITGVAAYSIAMQLGGIVISFGFGVSDAIQSAVSFNYGAKQLKRVTSFLRQGVITNIIFGIIVMTFSLLFGETIASIIVKDADTIKKATEILSYYSISFIVIGANIVVTTYYTSVDSPIISGILSILKSLVYILIWLMILPQAIGENGIWLALVFAEVSTTITAIIIYKFVPYGKTKKDHPVEMDQYVTQD